LSILRPPPPSTSTLFPYTTLFRSQIEIAPSLALGAGKVSRGTAASPRSCRRNRRRRRPPACAAGRGSRRCSAAGLPPRGSSAARSEEHTSELQSRGHLVCRLLLEK